MFGNHLSPFQIFFFFYRAMLQIPVLGIGVTKSIFDFRFGSTVFHLTVHFHLTVDKGCNIQFHHNSVRRIDLSNDDIGFNGFVKLSSNWVRTVNDFIEFRFKVSMPKWNRYTTDPNQQFEILKMNQLKNHLWYKWISTAREKEKKKRIFWFIFKTKIELHAQLLVGETIELS